MNTPALKSPRLPKLALLALLLCAACTGANKNGADGEDIVGKPPTRAEDPFSVTALPPPDARAPIKGSIDEPPPVTPTPPAEPARPAEVVARVEPARPTDVTPPVPGDEVRQCFACVRICPISDLSPDCSESQEDMICGWGAGADEEAARKLARAECNAALDMAREMPRWSSIDGSCPVATCRP
jgi:hypothetical protein